MLGTSVNDRRPKMEIDSVSGKCPERRLDSRSAFIDPGVSAFREIMLSHGRGSYPLERATNTCVGSCSSGSQIECLDLMVDSVAYYRVLVVDGCLG